MSTQETSHKHRIAFYNIENLFDTENDRFTNDDDYLPSSRKRWTTSRYENKLRKIAAVIAAIGDETEEDPPTIVGLAEVENKTVLRDLLKSSALAAPAFDFIHFDSSDERGMDVALLFNKQHVDIQHSEPLTVYLETEDGERDFTRDILYVKGILKGQALHLFVNHWSSRREGAEATEYKRLAASNCLLNKLLEIQSEDPQACIVVMGDFNDNPNDKSVKQLEREGGLFNPFKSLWSPHERGSINHKFEWHLFDQILFSRHLLNSHGTKLSFVDADIFDERFVTRYRGRFKGQPFRTYVGKKYLGGYSDHFPVFVNLKIQE
jgi:predicted extracellular nuclease